MVTYLVGYLAPVRAFDRFIRQPYELVPPDQRHLTLVYLGHINDAGALAAPVLSYPRRDPLVEFLGLRPLPSYERPRCLAALPSERDAGYLREVREALVGELGLPDADRYSSFVPHVTVARTRAKPSDALRLLAVRISRESSRARELVRLRGPFLMAAEGGYVRVVKP